MGAAAASHPQGPGLQRAPVSVVVPSDCVLKVIHQQSDFSPDAEGRREESNTYGKFAVQFDFGFACVPLHLMLSSPPSKVDECHECHDHDSFALSDFQ